MTDKTAIIPIVTPIAEEFFAPEFLVPNIKVTVAGKQQFTRPLAFGKRFDLLGISSTPELYESGEADPTDSLDPDLSVAAVWMHLPKIGKVVRLDAPKREAVSPMVGTREGGQMTLTYKHTHQFDQLTCVDGEELRFPLEVFAGVTVTGTLHTELGEIIMLGGLSEFRFEAREGEKLSSTEDLQARWFFKDAELIGYELAAYRHNHNRRRRLEA